MQVSAGGILPERPLRPPKMRLHIDGEGHGAVQYVQNMQNVHHVHRVIKSLNKFVKVGSSGNNPRNAASPHKYRVFEISKRRLATFWQHLKQLHRITKKSYLVFKVRQLFLCLI